jgi:hypothetical protein
MIKTNSPQLVGAAVGTCVASSLSLTFVLAPAPAAANCRALESHGHVIVDTSTDWGKEYCAAANKLRDACYEGDDMACVYGSIGSADTSSPLGLAVGSGPIPYYPTDKSTSEFAEGYTWTDVLNQQQLNYKNTALQSGDVQKNDGSIINKITNETKRFSYAVGYQLQQSSGACKGAMSNGDECVSVLWPLEHSPGVVSFEGVTPFVIDRFSPKHLRVEAMAELNGFASKEKLILHVIENVEPSALEELGIVPDEIKLKNVADSVLDVVEQAVTKKIAVAKKKNRPSSGNSEHEHGDEDPDTIEIWDESGCVSRCR